MNDYPLLNLFWTMMIFFIWVLWIFLLIRIFTDLFRSKDVGGGAKALWIILLILLPFLGVLIYLIVRGGSMHEREVEQVQASQQAFDDYVKQTAASSTNSADEIVKLVALRDQGVLSESEFQAQKAKLLV